MPWQIWCALTALAVGTLIVPAGAQLVGRLIEIAGQALQLYGEALSDGYAAFVGRLRRG